MTQTSAPAPTYQEGPVLPPSPWTIEDLEGNEVEVPYNDKHNPYYASHEMYVDGSGQIEKGAFTILLYWKRNDYCQGNAGKLLTHLNPGDSESVTLQAASNEDRFDEHPERDLLQVDTKHMRVQVAAEANILQEVQNTQNNGTIFWIDARVAFPNMPENLHPQRPLGMRVWSDKKTGETKTEIVSKYTSKERLPLVVPHEIQRLKPKEYLKWAVSSYCGKANAEKYSDHVETRLSHPLITEHDACLLLTDLQGLAVGNESHVDITQRNLDWSELLSYPGEGSKRIISIKNNRIFFNHTALIGTDLWATVQVESGNTAVIWIVPRDMRYQNSSINPPTGILIHRPTVGRIELDLVVQAGNFHQLHINKSQLT